MVDSCFSVAAICICAVMLSLLLKRYCREQSLFVALVACITVIGAFAASACDLLNDLREILEESEISPEYISVAFKAAAVCIITQITTELCRDSGEGAIASAAELWGRGTVVLLSVPIIRTLIGIIGEFL